MKADAELLALFGEKMGVSLIIERKSGWSLASMAGIGTVLLKWEPRRRNG